MRRCIAPITLVTVTLLTLTACGPSVGPLGQNFSVNTVCGPSRGRAAVSLAEVLRNTTGHRLEILEVQANHVENLHVKTTGVSSSPVDIPIISGNPAADKLGAFHSGTTSISQGQAFEYLVYGIVSNPDKDVVVHGFTIEYRLGGSSFEARTPSTLIFAAKDCT